MRIMFMGTPDFSTPCLEALVKAGHDVVGAVSQPDKPQGRGRKLVPTQVKQAAMRLGLPVFQPEKLRDGEFERILLGVDPELIVVVAYGKILPKFVLDYPKYGCINVHASLLPKYRGAGPIQRAIIDGEKVTGVTTMYMSEGLDEGDILLSRATEIAPDETAGELFDRLSELGAELLIETIEEIESGRAVRTKQDDALSSYAPMLKKEDGDIDWNKTAAEIVNLVRGTNPWPMAYTQYEGETMKVISARADGGWIGGEPGKILEIVSNPDKSKSLAVGCADGRVLIDELQFKGGKRMAVRDYLNGHEIKTGVILTKKS